MPGRTKRVFARIKRNAVVARIGYFGRKIKASKAQRTLVREATALLAFMREASCTFHRCSSLIANPVPMGVAYRYDVHVRDIPGSYAFAEFHRKQDVPATFFLFWDYSPVERRHFDDYRKLRALLSEPLEMALHDSPVDAFLIKAEFGGNRREYLNWTDSGDALEWLSAMTAEPQKLAAFNQAALADFIARVHQTRLHFGPFSLVGGHGGELGQSLRKKLKSLEPAVVKTARSLQARFWLTPERVAAAGLDHCVDRNDYTPQRWREVSDDGTKIANMAAALRERLLVKQNAVQLLLHPYTWSGGQRDAELSDLLNSSATVAAPGRAAI